MAGKKSYFTVGQYLFWTILALLFSLLMLHIGDRIFRSDRLAEELVLEELPPPIDTTSNVKPDTSKIISKDSIPVSWAWQDFDDKHHKIDFNIHKLTLNKAAENRLSSAWPLIYSEMYSHDRAYLKSFIDKMKAEIKQMNLTYYQAVEYVCSSIQFIPYTLILASDGDCPCVMQNVNFSGNCKVQEDGRGCCNKVDPFGVYSPIEFAYKKTADCDTRALMAYTILHEMGFDVAVMISESKSHSVLGIALPNANNFSYGTNMLGKKFVLWELTAWEWRLGMGVEGEDWKTALE
jgi:hypothetical protein